MILTGVDEETNVQFAESIMEQSPPITQHTQLSETWSPPDPGLNQRKYSEDEDDILNFSKERQDKHPGFCLENKKAVVRMPQEISFIYKKSNLGGLLL